MHISSFQNNVTVSLGPIWLFLGNHANLHRSIGGREGMYHFRIGMVFFRPLVVIPNILVLSFKQGGV